MNYGKASVGSQTVNWTSPTNMTSGNTWGGTTFAVKDGTNLQQAWKMFDGDATTSNGCTTAVNSYTFYFYYPTALKLTKAVFTMYAAGYAFTTVIKGSNDDSSYTQIFSSTLTADSNKNCTATITTNNSYKYYEVTFTRGGNYGANVYTATLQGTYTTTVTNTITFANSFTHTNYALSLAYMGNAQGNSYGYSRTVTGFSLQNNSNANNVLYMTMGY